MGDLTAYYAYPEATSKEMKRIIISGKGTSPRDVRQNVDLKTEQTMDLSALSTLLISDETAEGSDIYDYLDIYYRDVNNPITPRLALIQGELKPFFDVNKDDKSATGEFYNRFIKSLEENSIIIPYNLQTAGTILFEEAQDLTLPYLKLDDEKRPVAEGIALFSGRKFTGEKLTPEEGILLTILNNTTSQNTRLTYMYEKLPVSIRLTKSDRKINVSENKIEISIDIEAVLTEFPQGDLKNKETRMELQKYLSDKVEEEVNKVIEKLQEAKCDAIGLGRIVRAYHTKWYDKDWNNKFAELDIPVKVNIKIDRTGILN